MNLLNKYNDLSIPLYLPSCIKLHGLFNQDSFAAFLYARPIRFLRLSPNDLESCIQLYSALVIFNMALAHHRKGKMSKRRPLLEKAIRLYNMCRQLLETLENQGNQARDESRLALLEVQGMTALIHLAALNNRTQIHLDLDDPMQAQQGLDQLTAHMFGSHGGTIHQLLVQVEDDTLRGLLLNLMLTKPCNVALAA
jgi:hypothetical protein